MQVTKVHSNISPQSQIQIIDSVWWCCYFSEVCSGYEGKRIKQELLTLQACLADLVYAQSSRCVNFHLTGSLPHRPIYFYAQNKKSSVVQSYYFNPITVTNFSHYLPKPPSFLKLDLIIFTWIITLSCPEFLIFNVSQFTLPSNLLLLQFLSWV